MPHWSAKNFEMMSLSESPFSTVIDGSCETPCASAGGWAEVGSLGVIRCLDLGPAFRELGGYLGNERDGVLELVQPASISASFWPDLTLI